MGSTPLPNGQSKYDMGACFFLSYLAYNSKRGIVPNVNLKDETSPYPVMPPVVDSGESFFLGCCPEYLLTGVLYPSL